MASKMRKLREHVEACPFGCWDGKIIVARGTKDEQIIEWLAELRELVGIDDSSQRREAK